VTTERDLARLRRLPPAERLKAAGAAIEEARASMGKLAQIRAEAIAELRSEGWSLGRIAKELGVTRQQIHRLMRRQS
jgi:DNA-directed RNA polymerase specialized sigma24 family protein